MSAKANSEKTGAKKSVDHPKFAEMVKLAILALKERNGSSVQAIEKYIRANFKVGDNARQHIKTALKRGEANGQFIHTKGVGATGSFKVNKKVEKKTVPAKKKPVVKSEKKAKKPATKKLPTKKKPAEKAVKNEKKSRKKETVSKDSKAKKPTAKKTTGTKAAVKKTVTKKVKSGSKK